MGRELELRILGPFEVLTANRVPVPLGGLRQRAVLAVLTLNANQVVSTDRLIDELWGESVPGGARHTLQVFVSRLRSALGPWERRLRTRPPGYVLEVEAHELDANRFEQLFLAARASLLAGGSIEPAAQLAEALGLWHGPPLADFTYEPFAQGTIARLEELRLNAREELIEAQLRLGRHAEVLSDLETLIYEQPFRERPRGQLMLALYRCGRQAEALQAFQDARQTLIGELAVEPAAALRELEQAILRQDPGLDPPARGGREQPHLASPQPIQPAADTSPGSPTPGETMVRKTVTVLVGAFTPSVHADPEAARALVGKARTDAEQAVSRHGGTFVGGLGRDLVWVFGLPLVAEDDVLRALRAAGELRELSQDARRLAVRIAVATGEVVAKRAEDVYGDPLDRAIELSTVARAGEILIADTTRQLAFGNVRVDPGPQNDAWRLLETTDGTHSGRAMRSAPIIGRDNELACARAVFDRVVTASEPHLLTVLGEAGIGKSRLAQEIARQLQADATVLRGRCLSYGDGIAFWPWREALTPPGAPDSLQRIRGWLRDAADADAVTQIIATALGLTSGEASGEQVPWAFRRLFEVMSVDRPVVVVLEDVHWAKPPLLELVDHLVDWLRAPVMVLCLARPELLDVRPRWGGGHTRVGSVVLAPLSDGEARRLLENHLADLFVDDREKDQILAAAEGNPLFVEQLLHSTIEDPASQRRGSIPGTIQSLLAARLDRLGPGERAYIERAAVIGREFWPAAVRELLPPEARGTSTQHLHGLVRRGLIQPDTSGLAGHDQLRFHHILIRDVAYSSTPKSLRAALHHRFADWLCALGDQYDEFVGYHLERAFTYRVELEGMSDQARDTAVAGAERLAAAGRRAVARGETTSAVPLLRTATELLEAAGQPQPQVWLDFGTALGEAGELRDAERVLKAAQECADAADALGVSARALIELTAVRAVTDRTATIEETTHIVNRAMTVFRRLGDDAGLARGWMELGEVHWTRCRFADMESALDQALVYAQRAHVAREERTILRGLARAATMGPRPVEDAIGRCSMVLERVADDAYSAALAESMLAILYAMHGHIEEARRLYSRAHTRFTDVGLSVAAALQTMYWAFVEQLAPKPLDLSRVLVDTCGTLEHAGDSSHLSTIAALLARLLYRDGRYDRSEHYATVAADAAAPDDVVTQVLWRGVSAKLLARAGRTSDAASRIADTVALAATTDFSLIQGDALRDRGEVLVLMRDEKQAMRALDAAIDIYRAKDIRVSAEAAIRTRESLNALVAVDSRT